MVYACKMSFLTRFLSGVAFLSLGLLSACGLQVLALVCCLRRRAFVPSPVTPRKVEDPFNCSSDDLLSSSLSRSSPGVSSSLTASEGFPGASSGGAATGSGSMSPWRFVSVDYSQMELHILAYLSNDPQLLWDLRGGRRDKETEGRSYDTFQLAASRLFNCPPEDVTKELRSMAKTVTYGEQQPHRQKQPVVLSETLAAQTTFKVLIFFEGTTDIWAASSCWRAGVCLYVGVPAQGYSMGRQRGACLGSCRCL